MKRGKVTDFSELEALADRIGQAVHLDDRNSKFNRETIIKAGAYKQLEQLVKDTPIGKDGSNWFDYTFKGGEHTASYFEKGRSSKAGTLARGWVSDSPQIGKGKPTREQTIEKVNYTPILREGKNLTMEFYNTTPYARAVEYGHRVRYPYFWDENRNYVSGVPRGHGPIVGYVAGQRFIMAGILNGEEAVKKAMSKELHKQIKSVVKKK